MLISQELFDRIVGVPHVAETTRAVLPVGCRKNDDRRRMVRRTLGKRAQVCADGGRQAGRWVRVLMRDISPMGVGLVADEPMTVGATFVLKVKDAADEPVRIRCVVRRCEPGGYGSAAFLIGSEFEQVIRDQVILVDGERVETDPAPETAGVMAKVARGLLRVSSWVGRADDYSS